MVKKRKKEIDLLLENFVLLQKTLADVSLSLKKLEKNFSKFLEVIEKAAQEKIEGEEKKIEKEGKKGIEKRGSLEDLEEKINLLIEQNKAMAEGMILLEKFLKERLEELEK